MTTGRSKSGLNLVRTNINWTPRDIDNLQFIRKRFGLSSNSSAVRLALSMVMKYGVKLDAPEPIPKDELDSILANVY
jgi:hypothetical protein